MIQFRETIEEFLERNGGMMLLNTPRVAELVELAKQWQTACVETMNHNNALTDEMVHMPRAQLGEHDLASLAGWHVEQVKRMSADFDRLVEQGIDIRTATLQENVARLRAELRAAKSKRVEA